MYHSLVLTIHIAAVAAWLGANLTQLTLMRRFAKESSEVAASWFTAVAALGKTYYNAAGVTIALTGVLLVVDGDIEWSAKFVSLGFVTIIVGAVLGVTVFGPKSEAAAEAYSAGDTTTATAITRRIFNTALVDTSLVLVTILAMVDKWGL